jgi:hypothetical protein
VPHSGPLCTHTHTHTDNTAEQIYTTVFLCVSVYKFRAFCFRKATFLCWYQTSASRTKLRFWSPRNYYAVWNGRWRFSKQFVASEINTRTSSCTINSDKICSHLLARAVDSSTLCLHQLRVNRTILVKSQSVMDIHCFLANINRSLACASIEDAFVGSVPARWQDVTLIQSVEHNDISERLFWLRFIVAARFSAPVQTGPGAHPASYTMGTRSFLGLKRPGRGVDHPPI